MYNNRIDRTRAESNRVNLDVKLFVWLGEGSEAALVLVLYLLPQRGRTSYYAAAPNR
jgi:hypothetical protein